MSQEQLNFGISYETKITGVEEGKKELDRLKKAIDETGKDGVKVKLNDSEIKEAKRHIEALEKSIAEADKAGGNFGEIFSRNLKSTEKNVKSTKKEVDKVDKSLKDLDKTAKSGNGFNAVSKSAKLAAAEIKGTKTEVDKLRSSMEAGFGQTLAFGILGGITGSVAGAVKTAYDLDSISTDISVVAGKTADEMERYRDAAYEASRHIDTTAQKYLEASLIYEQQGGDAAYYSQDLAEATVIAANITRTSTSAMSEYLTATMNGFDLLQEKGAETGMYIADVLSRLGAVSGSDLSEIAQGLSRTANTAKDAGFEFEEIATMIALVSEKTRRTPQTIGNAFKSILSSFTQLREASAEEVNLFTSKIEEAFKLGGLEHISMFDNGNLRQASDIFKDIAKDWDKMTIEQQALMTEAIAGKEQAEVLRAFFNAQERYNDLLIDAYGAAGTAANQQLIYADSMQAKIENLQNAWQGATNKVVETGIFKSALEDLTNLISLVADAKTGIGGLAIALSSVASPVGNFMLGPKIGQKFAKADYNNRSLSLNNPNLSPEAKKQIQDEVEYLKEIDRIQRNLGDNAVKRYEELQKEIDKLDEELDILNKMNKTEEERIELAKQASKGLSPEGYSPQIYEKVRETHPEETLEYTKKETEELNRQRKILEDIKNNKEKVSALEESLIKKEKIKKDITLEKIRSDKVFLSNLEKEISTETKHSSEMKKQLDIIKKRASVKKQGDNSHKEAMEKIISLSKQEIEELKKSESLDKEKIKDQEKIVQLAEKELRLKELTFGMKINEEANSKNIKDLEMKKKAAEEEKKYTSTSAKSGATLNTVIRATSTAYGVITPVIASYNSVQRESISLQEGVVAGLQGVSGALLLSMNPWAMAGGAILGFSSVAVKHFGLFKTEAEKAKDANEELIKSFISLQEDTAAKMSNLRDIESSYALFQGSQAEEILRSGSKEDIEAYTNMVDKLIDVYPELIQYYNENGIAVVDLSQSYDELIQKQREQITANAQMMSNNFTGFYLEYNDTLSKTIKKQSELTKGVQESRVELEKAKLSGDEKAISKAIGDVAKFNNELNQINGELAKVKGSIQSNLVSPFIEAKGTIEGISASAQNEIKSFLSESFNINLVERLVAEGDEERLETIQKNLSIISIEFEKLEKKESGAGIAFLKDAEKLPETTKNFILLNKELKTIEDFIEASQNFGQTGSGIFTDEMIKGTQEAIKEFENLDLTIKDLESNLKTVNLKTSIGAEVDPYELSRQITGQAEYRKQADPSQALLEEQDLETKKSLLEKSVEIADAFRSENEALSVLREGYNETTQSLEGLTSTIDSLSELNSLSEVLDGSFDSFEEQLEKISEISPEIGERMKESFEQSGQSAEDAGRIIREQAEITQKTKAALIEGALGDDENYYAAWAQKNQAQLESLSETFGINVDNITSLNELRHAALSGEVEYEQEVAKDKVSIDNKVVKRKEENALLNTDIQKQFLDLGFDNEEQIRTISAVSEAAHDAAYVALKEATHKKVLGIFKKSKKLTDEEQQEIVDKAYDAEFDRLMKQELDKQAKTQQKIKELNASNDIKTGLYNNELSNFDFDIDLGTDILEQQRKASEDAKKKADKARQDALKEKEDSFKLDTTKTPEEKNKEEKKEKETKEKEVADLDLDFNRYYKLDNSLKKLTNEYNALGKAKANAYGDDKIKLMNRERENLQKQSALLNKYIKELEKEQKEKRESLQKKGFTFDENGDIANLNQRLEAMQREANKKTGEAKEQAIKEIKDLQAEAQRYTDITFNLLPDKKAAQAEHKKLLSDLAKEEIEYKVKLSVDKNDFKNELFEVLKEMQDDYTNLDEKAQLTQKQMDVGLNNISIYEKQIEEIKRNKDLTDNEREEMLNQANKNLLGAISQTRAAYKEFQAIQIDFIKQSVEAIDKLSERYENIISKSDQMIKKQKELYGYNDTAKINELYNIQLQALDNQNDMLQKNQANMIKYRDSLEEGTDAWKAANDEVNKMGETISDNLIKKMDILKAQFDDFVKGIQESFDKMFGTWGFKGARDDLNELKKEQDKYMSDFEKYTTLGDQIKSINDEIAKTNDPAKAKELAELRDKEFQSLMEKDKVSKAEYERAMMLYDIKQKELALQERENAKRSVQMVRDQNGNMTYQYMREENADLEKERQEIQKKKQDLYKFDSDQLKKSAEETFDIIQDYQNKVGELSNKGLSEEEYIKELEKLQQETQKKLDQQAADRELWLQKAGEDGLDLLSDGIHSGSITAEQIGVDEDVLNAVFDAIADGSLTVHDMLTGNYDDFADSLGKTVDEISDDMDRLLEVMLKDNLAIAQAMIDASDNWTSTAGDNVEALGNAYANYMNQASSTLDDYNKKTGELNVLLKDTNKASKDVTESIKKQTDAMEKTSKATNNTSKEVKNLEEKLIGKNGSSGLYGAQVKLQKHQNEQLRPELKRTEQDMGKLRTTTNNTATAFSNVEARSTSTRRELKRYGENEAQNSKRKIAEIGTTAQTTANSFDSIRKNAKDAIVEINKFSNAANNLKGYGSYKVTGSGKKIVSMDSGGYTGTWDNSSGNKEGRMAMLHEKELVLNKEDTENLLAAVSLQRELINSMKSIGEREMVQQMNQNITNAQSSIVNNVTKNSSSPNVTINADFPNVKDSSEIEKSLTGLYAKASTYVGKK